MYVYDTEFQLISLKKEIHDYCTKDQNNGIVRLTFIFVTHDQIKFLFRNNVIFFLLSKHFYLDFYFFTGANETIIKT